jgi:hypothetical protein
LSDKFYRCDNTLLRECVIRCRAAPLPVGSVQHVAVESGRARLSARKPPQVAHGLARPLLLQKIGNGEILSAFLIMRKYQPIAPT